MHMRLSFSILMSGPLWFKLSEFLGIKNSLSYFDSGSDLSTNHSTKLKSKLITKESAPKGICCINCQTQITHAKHAIEVEGKHQHIVTNPDGITFNISLYSQATCHAQSAAIGDFSWFVGYEWRVVVCSECLQHLGWSYQKDHSPDFYGLITDKLIDFDK